MTTATPADLGAALDALELATPDPAALARFHAAAFRLAPDGDGARVVCAAPGRRLVFHAGAAGALVRAGFRFHRQGDWAAHRQALRARGVALAEDGEAGYSLRDPEGHLLAFRPPRSGDEALAASTARLQHFALRTPAPQALATFYVDTLGFTVSDRVLDAQGGLTAIFLRSDAEHHVLALFRAPEGRFDHFSCEVPGWADLRDWADHMATQGITLAWGVGRHGPGNDTFLMVRDPDGNMGEISAELEVCAPGRPAGTWPHHPQTLNQWGVAIMRS